MEAFEDQHINQLIYDYYFANFLRDCREKLSNDIRPIHQELLQSTRFLKWELDQVSNQRRDIINHQLLCLGEHFVNTEIETIFNIARDTRENLWVIQKMKIYRHNNIIVAEETCGNWDTLESNSWSFKKRKLNRNPGVHGYEP